MLCTWDSQNLRFSLQVFSLFAEFSFRSGEEFFLLLSFSFILQVSLFDGNFFPPQYLAPARALIHTLRGLACPLLLLKSVLVYGSGSEEGLRAGTREREGGKKQKNVPSQLSHTKKTLSIFFHWPVLRPVQKNIFFPFFSWLILRILINFS